MPNLFSSSSVPSLSVPLHRKLPLHHPPMPLLITLSSSPDFSFYHALFLPVDDPSMSDQARHILDLLTDRTGETRNALPIPSNRRPEPLSTDDAIDCSLVLASVICHVLNEFENRGNTSFILDSRFDFGRTVVIPSMMPSVRQFAYNHAYACALREGADIHLTCGLPEPDRTSIPTVSCIRLA